ncbi:ATP-binding protein [Sphingomonas sp.]|uniref:ATP-binding protein n=1 Tax=Sphingomonas sp. TaxID=28214 RepID=UPI003D6CD495
MTAAKPGLARAIARDEEGEAIVALISARLDRLRPDADQAETMKAIVEADRVYAALPDGGALARILALFGATEADRAVMLTCIAPEFDPRLLNRYHELIGRTWATDWLVSILFARPGQMLLSGTSALLRWQLIAKHVEAPGEPPALIPDPAVRAWLMEEYGIPLRLSGKARFVDVLPPLSNWPVAETVARLRRAFDRGLPVLMSVAGLEGAGRTSFAAQVADSFGLHTIAIDPATDGTPWTSDDTVVIQRLAHVANAALVWRKPPPAGSLAPGDRGPPPLQAITLGPGDTAPPPGRLAPFEVILPAMPPAERARMIKKLVPTAEGWTSETRSLLASRAALTPGAITRLGQVAPENDAEAIAATNATQSAVMGSLAERMTGEVGWDDLILPGQLASDLKDLAYEARTRHAVWESAEMARLFPRERGLVALFYGAPGTGKTMAAQVVAGEMGVDLYRIDCSSVISKYIGETSKNIAAIFARARQIDALLFFDEAEALFSKRTDVTDSNDRYANTDTANLLQLIEGQFEGTALLATNRKADMDSAFLRRIRYTFEFPRPTEQARTTLWQRSVTALAPDRAKALDNLWPVLGAALDFTGAQIKTTLLSAHFAAARREDVLGPEQILRAAERELIKDGRSLGNRDRERIKSACPTR